MKSKRIEISLGGSGMTSFHRAGLAGLYMTLDELAKDEIVEKELNDAVGKWKLYNDKVTIDWNQNPEFFEK